MGMEAAKTGMPMRPVGALVLFAPFTSLPDLVMAHAGLLLASFTGHLWNVAELLREPALKEVPLCIVHPRDDEVIPLPFVEAMLEGAASAPELKHGVWLSGETHNFCLEVEHTAIVGDFVADYLVSTESCVGAGVAMEAEQ